MALAFERVLAPSPEYPAPAVVETAAALPKVAVVFTSAVPTIAALEKAGALAGRVNGRVSLVVPQVVPYPLPLESPPVLLDFSERQFREIAGKSPVEVTVEIHLCRDRVEALQSVLAPGSLVVIGGRKRWWPTREKLLARHIRRAGHEVVFTETE